MNEQRHYHAGNRTRGLDEQGRQRETQNEQPQVNDEPSTETPPAIAIGNHTVTQSGSAQVQWGSRAAPIAITGMAMRLPGGIRNAEDFWDILVAGKDGHCRVPESRYNMDTYHSTSRAHSVRTKGGYFLQENPALFDRSFFNLMPDFSALLDPQNRLLAEVAWECLENAGETKIRGRNIGCFVGAFATDWMEMAVQDRQDLDRNHVYRKDFISANLVSQLFDLMGPSVTYKTACSSSLTALHDACNALYAGDCDAAIVAGTNLLFSPFTSASMSDHGGLSPSGICKSFDADADGYSRGEAVNAIFIKRLDDAVQGNDPIRAVIRATACNSDGHAGMTGAPRAKGQEQVIRKAYQKAGICDFSQTAFFECHGTGTQKGDIVETSVIANIFQDGMVIGSVKPNLGHSEGASGLSSVIKAVLTLEHRLIPPNIHFHRPNPRIPFETGKLEVPREPTDWPQGRAERVSINSFGVGGSNAHVILDSASSFCKMKPDLPAGKAIEKKLLLLSAHMESSLQSREKEILRYVHAHPHKLQDTAYTLGKKREHLDHRGFLVTDGKSTSPGRHLQIPVKKASPAMTLVFSGQGAQWPGMGKELISQIDSFRDDIRQMDNVLQSLEDPPQWKLEEALCNASDINANEAELAQPLCTAIQIGLVNLLRYWGIKPDSVAGHSSGEIAAAYAAGAIPLSTAIILGYYRGQVTKLQKEPGGMVVLGLNKSAVLPYLAKGVTVACENSPSNITLSGTSETLEEAIKRISFDFPDALCKRLPMEVAYHSEHMLKAGRAYAQLTETHICPNQSMIPMFSCVTSQKIISPDELSSAYWRQTIESPVEFYQSISLLIKESHQNRVLVEVGPNSLLSGPLRQIFEACGGKSQLEYIPTLLKNKDPIDCLLSTAGELYLHHIPLDLLAINGPGRVLTDLPSYPWHHNKQYWYESRISREWRNCQFPHHQLLGSPTSESTTLEPSWRNRLNVEHVPWLLEHKVENDIIYPCVGYISMVGEAIRQVTGFTSFSISQLFMQAPMILQKGTPTEIVTSLRSLKLTDSLDSSWYEFTVSAFDGKQWRKHCAGQARGGKVDEWGHVYSQPRTFVRRVQPKVWYDAMKRRGLNMGPNFRRLEDITADPIGYQAAAMVGVEKQDDLNDGQRIHPVIIDQGLQLLGIASCNGMPRRLTNVGVPVSIDRIYVVEAAEKTLLQASFVKRETGSLCSSLGGSAMGYSNGQLAFTLEGAKFFPLNQPTSTGVDVPLAARLEWRPDIDFLHAKEFLFKSLPKGSSMELVMKLMVIAIVDLFDQMGLGSSTFSGFVKTHQAWTETNFNRLLDIIRSFLPDVGDWASDPIQLHSRLLRDVTTAAESCEPWIQPIRGYLTKVIDALDDQVPFWELLMDDGGFKSIYEFAATRVDLGHTFLLLGHSNPYMAVLEINSSTCGTTSGALDALRSDEGVRLYSKYTFASQSSDLLKEASEKFGDIGAFSCLPLDPTRDLVAQGFELGTYDLVIIPSDLPSILSSGSFLHEIRSLLVPGGRLLVREVTPAVPFIDYLMSMIPPPFSLATELQLGSPYNPDFWKAELCAAGFLHPEFHTCSMSVYPWSKKQAILAKVPHLEPEKSVIYLLCPKESHPWAQHVKEQLNQHGYEVYCATMDDLSVETKDIISLLDIDVPFLEDISRERYDAFIKCLSQRRRILWVTKSSQIECDDPSSGLITGFARTVRLEAGVEFATLEIDDYDQPAAKALINVYQKFCRQSLERGWDPECEFALHNGVIHVGRFHWLPMKQVAPCDATDCPATLTVDKPGSLESVTWKHNPTPDLRAEDVEVDVHFVGLNFRDIMVAMGAIDGERGLGLEASGIVRSIGSNVTHLKPGDKVNVLGTGLFSSRITTSSHLCFPVASDISLEVAATLPVAYGTAIYSLLTVGQLERGQSVLIHSACGAVGQAAIHIAQMMKAKVYVTVGTDEKIQYLEKTFGIPRENIFHSRNTSFVAGIMAATGGQGVDIVLNSLAGELLHASWRCVAKFGKFVEIGKRDFMGHGRLQMESFGANRTFIGVDLLQLALENPGRFEKLGEMFIRLSQRGKIKPIRPVKIFKAYETRDAFTYMQRGTHIGKILIRFDGENAAGDISKAITTTSSAAFGPDAAYLLVGGLGGLGRAVSTWMVENGARHLVFLSRSGAQSSDEQAFLEELRYQGCQPIAIAGSVANIEDVERAIEASPMQICGVIHLGMVLKPAPLLETSYDDWLAVQDPKVKGAWNLHSAFDSKTLDFFVVLSSIAALGGSVGQVSYASANTYLDALVRHRRSLGLPAATINLGAISDIGAFAQEPRLLEVARQWEFQLLDEGHVMEAMQAAIRVSQSHCSNHGLSASGQVIVGMGTTRAHSDPGSRIPWHDARYRLFGNIGPTESTAQAEAILDRIKRLLTQAQQNPRFLKQPEAEDLFLEYIAQQINEKARNQAERAQVSRMNIDSIVTMQAVAHIRRNLGIHLSMANLSGVTTVGNLGERILAAIYEKANSAEEDKFL